MDTHPTEVSGDGRPATLAVAGVTKAICRACGWSVTWETGEDAITMCEDCGTVLTITAATGRTAEEAIARAAQEIPEKVEPRQPSIPGLKPVFDLAAALDAIEEAALDARLAERDYEQAHEITKGKRKTADAANTKLRDLIADLTERRHDARYEPKEAADGEIEESTEFHGRDVSGPRDAYGMSDGLSAVARVGGTDGQDPSAGAVSDVSPVGDLDAEDTPSDEAFRPLQELLRDAGAMIMLGELVAWTPEQIDDASAWAHAQIAAHGKDKPGHHTSVKWPAHVSAAAYKPTSDDTRAPKLRQAARTRVKTASSRSNTARAPRKGRRRGA